MRLQFGDLIKVPTYNQTVKWYATDSEESFQANMHKIPARYRDADFDYKFNSLGYRCDELTSYTSNFFIALGCSHTAGVGIPIEDTWGEQLANSIGYRCMNLGIGGASLDAQLTNTIRYISNPNYAKPNFVILQHTETARTGGCVIKLKDREVIEIDVDTQDTNIRYNYPPVQDMPEDYTEIEMNLYYRNAQYTDAITMLWNSLGVPIIHWTYASDGENPFAMYKIAVYPMSAAKSVDLDYGRDLTHNGYNTNKYIAHMLQEQLDILDNRLHIPFTKTCYIERIEPHPHHFEQAVLKYRQGNINE